MSISNVSSVWANPYAYTNSSSKTTSTGNFAQEVQKAEEDRNTAASVQTGSTDSGTIKYPGDVTINYPPNLSNISYDSSISAKSKDEMTLDEYKQWVMNEISQMPVSGWVRSTFSSGAIVIKEEAFEAMKNDPEYENYVLNRVRSGLFAQGLSVGSNHVSYDVIGASPEQCYGYAGPAGGSGSNISDDGESWWEKRHKKLEELMEEQEKEAVKKAQARRAEAQENYLKSQMASRQRQQAFLAEGIQDGTGAGALQSAGVSALAATAYEESISTFSKSVMESQKI
ncbi:MAG: hypothetical protein HDQ97_15415 [Lachnospiraceae bacterium]|nr:hypothetical protein [Lachnospiraceae bacterium]